MTLDKMPNVAEAWLPFLSNGEKQLYHRCQGLKQIIM